MQAAEAAVEKFLHHGNKHSVDIEQETKPAVVHERVAQRQHEDVITAVDREVHQHHHQIHVQPIQHSIVESEKHHHNLIPIEHRKQHHGKDVEVERALLEHQSKFRDEREVLPVQTTSTTKTVVGEHVHHHIHDIIQPVIERETIQPHVVHTTVPIHEHIEHEPFIHKGNVLPAMSFEEFTKAGHSLTGHKKSPEHIEYEGEPLKIDGKSHVGFGQLGSKMGLNTGLNTGHHTSGTTPAGASAATYSHRRSGSSSSSSSDESNRVPRSLASNTGRNQETLTGTQQTTAPHKSSLLNKLDPRV